MHNSKFIRLLGTLTPEEFRRFEIFLKSPFYNTNKNLLRLLQYIGRYHPRLTSPKLAKEKVWKFLYPKEGYDDNRLRQRIFMLSKLLENFLTTIELEGRTDDQKSLFLKALDKRGLHADFTKNIRQKIQRLEAESIKNPSTYQQLHQYYQQLYFHPDTPKFQAGGTELRECIHNLDQYFILKKLEYGCEAASREVLFSEAYPDWLLERIQEGTKELPELESALAVRLYQDLIQLQKQEKNQALFTQIKTLFINQANALSPEQRISIYQYLSNYAARRVNTGERQYYAELFDLTKMALRYHIIIEQDRITDATFTNTVVMASVLKEFDWAKQFMNQYQTLLEPKVFNSAFHLAMAYWHYHQQNQLEVLSHLRDVYFLPSYGYRVKSLRTRSFYELFQQDDSYYEPVLAEINSFEQYIRREKTTTTYRKQSYLNLVSYLKKLVRIKNNPKWSWEKTEQLREEIENKQPVFAKHWLLEKVIKYL